MTGDGWRSWLLVDGVDLANQKAVVGVGLHVSAQDNVSFWLRAGRRGPVWLAQAAACQLVLNLRAAINAELPVEHELPGIDADNNVVPVATGWTSTNRGLQVTIGTGTRDDVVILPDDAAERLVVNVRRVVREWLKSGRELW